MREAAVVLLAAAGSTAVLPPQLEQPDPQDRHPVSSKKNKNCADMAARVAAGVVATAVVATAVGVGVAAAIEAKKPPRKRRLRGALIRMAQVKQRIALAAAGRKRRSIRDSKVPAEILDQIPMNFERLY